MGTPTDYNVGADALLGLEKQIIASKNVPSFMVPSDAVLRQYALQAAQVCIDAVDAARAKGSTS